MNRNPESCFLPKRVWYPPGPLTTLFWHLCFWHRKWEKVDAVEEVWKSESAFDVNLNLNTGTATVNNVITRKTLILEKCAWTGFERAYYQVGDDRERVSVTYAKNKFGWNKPTDITVKKNENDDL
jgi:hypothetical protein